MTNKISLFIVISLSLYIHAATVSAADLAMKIEAAMELGDYNRQEYLALLSLSPSEISTLKQKQYNSNEGAQLLLALNCEAPPGYESFKALYAYRCKNAPLATISPYVLADPDRDKALYYLAQYEMFLKSLAASGKGIPVGTDYREYLEEITAFIKAGGIGSNQPVKPTR